MDSEFECSEFEPRLYFKYFKISESTAHFECQAKSDKLILYLLFTSHGTIAFITCLVSFVQDDLRLTIGRCHVLETLVLNECSVSPEWRTSSTKVISRRYTWDLGWYAEFLLKLELTLAPSVGNVAWTCQLVQILKCISKTNFYSFYW